MSTTLSKPQSLANHRAFPPAWYFLAGVVIMIEIGRRIWHALHDPSLGELWGIVVAVAVLCVWIASRSRAQIVQDRVIRHEMQLRLERILGAARRGDIARLPLNQLIALRFASDAEMPGLFEEALLGQLENPEDIKRRIKDWQADWLRV